MAIATYSDLKTAVADYAWRTGDTAFEARVPDFIALAEARLGRDLRIGAMEKVVTLPLVNGAAALPSDYLEMRAVSSTASVRRNIDLISPDEAVALYPASLSGTSRHYTLIGDAIQLYPGGDGDVSMTYYAAIPALSDGSPTNWLLTKAPDAYLYASLLESMPYMKDDGRAQVWKTYYDTAVEGLKRADITARFGRMSIVPRGPTP